MILQAHFQSTQFIQSFHAFRLLDGDGRTWIRPVRLLNGKIPFHPIRLLDGKTLIHPVLLLDGDGKTPIQFLSHGHGEERLTVSHRDDRT